MQTTVTKLSELVINSANGIKHENVSQSEPEIILAT